MTIQESTPQVRKNRDGRAAVADLGHSRLDLDRERRCGHPEVVFGEGKTAAELVDVVRALMQHHGRALVTRVGDEAATQLTSSVQGARHHKRARLVTVGPLTEGEGDVLVVSAGTSDAAVAEEAAISARFLGARVGELRDVGVAGLHRLMAEEEVLGSAQVVIVVAGMEGALPSVVGGLVDRPVIAVPTSIGYGAAFEGITALLSMLNSCASGVTVVNIDNGFGAAYAAAQINRAVNERTKESVTK